MQKIKVEDWNAQDEGSPSDFDPEPGDTLVWPDGEHRRLGRPSMLIGRSRAYKIVDAKGDVYDAMVGNEAKLYDRDKGAGHAGDPDQDGEALVILTHAEARRAFDREKRVRYRRKTKTKGDKSESNDNTTSKETDMSEDSKKTEPKFTSVSVMYVQDPKDRSIKLPVDPDGRKMTYGQARSWLTKIEEEETRSFAFSYRFKDWYPFDAMWAVYRAMVENYGFAHVADFRIETFFGVMKKPPSSITIDVARGVKRQIPWGPVEVNGLSVPLTPAIDFHNGLPCLTLSAEIRNNERQACDELMRAAERMLETSSIYRGKAVEVDFTVFNPKDIKYDEQRAPKFIDTDVREHDLILPKHVTDQLDFALWTPIRNAQLCRDHKIPLRRGTLLSGKYGVGKSLASQVTAMLCEKNGWTFLYLRDLKQLAQALVFAKRYEPCVVFAEDINRIVDGDRDAEMDKLFNVVDGIDRKNDEVMIVFTTNEVDTIHAGMLRPGRIDSIVTITPPDAEAVKRLVRHYGRDLLASDADLDMVGELLAGQIPAIIREAVEKAKIASIRDAVAGQPLRVTSEHLVIAAHQMLAHAELLKEAPAAKPDLVVLGEAIGTIIADGIRRRVIGFDHDDGQTDGETVSRGLPTHLLDEAGRPNGKRTHTAE